MHRVGMFNGFSHNRMAGLVKGNDFFLLRIHHPVLFCKARNHPVDGFVEIRQSHRFFIFTGSQEGGLVNEVGQVRAHKSRGAAGDLTQIDIGCQ